MNRTELDEISWSIHPKIKSAERNKAEAAYIDSVMRFVGRKTGKTHKTILDVPCGTGRLHAYLRRYGYNVSGIDTNEAFIISARKKYRKYMTDYHTANMKSFRLNRKFDVVLCWFTSFGYLGRQNDLLTVKSFACHLNDSGILLLHVLNEEWYSKEWENAHKKNYEINEGRKFLRLASTSLSRKKGHLYLSHSSRIYKKSNGNLLLSRKFKQAITVSCNEQCLFVLSRFQSSASKYVFCFDSSHVEHFC